MRPPGSSLERGLKDFVNTLKPNIMICEIGCFAGDATKIFLTKARKVFCVDPWSDYTEDNGAMGKWEVKWVADVEKVFDRELAQELKSARVVKCKMPSVEAAQRFNRIFDVVYIDGNHSIANVIEDIQVWSLKVKEGGILAGHDYDRVPVQDAVKRLLGQPDRLFEDYTWIKNL